MAALSYPHLNDPYVPMPETDEDYAASVRVLGGRTIIHIRRVGEESDRVLKTLTPAAMDALCMAWIRYRMNGK